MSFSNFNLQKLSRLLLVLILVQSISSCNRKQEIVTIDPEIAKYIAGFTSGVISKTAPIKIQLAVNTKSPHVIGEYNGAPLFETFPAVKGKIFWTDARTIEFRPEKNLEPGKLYTITFRLGKVADVPDKFEDFVFNVETISPAFVVKDEGLRSSGDKEKMFFPGTIETADFEDDKTVEKLLKATHNDDKLQITWQHNTASRTHHFTVDNIRRGTNDDAMTLQWDGAPMNSKIKGSESVKVPAIGNFTLLDVRAVNEDGQYVSVLFSDPISITQELDGLITISGQENITHAINGSEVKLFPSQELEGDYTVNVANGIQNTFGASLSQSLVSNISFDTRKPSVRMEGKGNILPHEGKMTLPFSAVNLNAVDVSIIKVYENNIPQFLQNNDYGGDNNLRQVAAPVVQQTIRLDDDKTLDLHKRQRFALDIDKYLKAEPGAIYRVVIGFRPGYSLYDCSDSTRGKSEDDEPPYNYEDPTAPDDQEAFWSRYDNYYPYGYNWRLRDNPCHQSYYNKEKFAFRNIIASNIGIIAQRSSDNELTVVATDMITAKPMEGAEVKVLDYQQQVVGKGTTDNDGFVKLPVNHKPFLVIVAKGNEKGYLKVDDGSSLALSRFDIAGEEVQNGIKGFIFGERGVWRPGDSLFINFIEKDQNNKLPEGHPIEFELYGPTGQLYTKMVQQNNTGGFNVFRTATNSNAPTGNWRAKVHVGGATFEKTIKIETVMPNRLTINLDFGSDTLLGKNRNNEAVLKADWLFGAPASNLDATVDLSLSAGRSTFAKYSGFTFTNPVANVPSQTVTVFKGKLNEEGKANIKAGISVAEEAPGMMRANLLMKVFEPGGAFSIKTMSLPYSPYTSYAGIRLPEGDKTWGFLTTGTSHTAQIVDVNPNGVQLEGNQTMEISFYKIQWRWWWDRSSEEFSNFTQDKYNKLISHEIITLNNGKGQWNFKVPRNAWGRYLVLVKDQQSGHTTGSTMYIDDPGWQSRDNTDDPTAASMLSFTSDKPSYNAGENITLTVPTSEGGRGLISVSSGSKVLKSWWFETKIGQTQVQFKAEKNWAPNIYAQVSLLQPYGQTTNDLPMRMYGVIPIRIDNKETILSPVIEMASVIRPEQRTSITVSEKNHKEMWYTIAIVDEGLLDLTNFKIPNPHNYFFAREALSVKTWDIFDYVIGAHGFNIERILTIGGDQEGTGPVHQKQANRFKPVVKFLGPFKLEKGKTDKRSFELPQYAGAVRVMVVAAGENAYGSADKMVQVKKPLMMLATLPRVLSPGEKTKIPVTVFATESNIKSANVQLQTNPSFEIEGTSAQTVRFEKPGEQTIFYNVIEKEQTGIGKIRLIASAGNEKADYETEMDIRNANPYVTSVVSATINSGQSEPLHIKPIGNNSNTVVEISAAPPIDLQRHLDYLIDYPHGCAEQITSKAFAQLFLGNLISLTDKQKASVDQNIKDAISTLKNFQSPDGGFAYWPGDRQSDEWATNYAGHFLLKATEAGYFVPTGMLQQWKSFERSKANSWAPSTTQFYVADLIQAYRLFVLALSKSPEIGAMNRLREFKYIAPEAKWRLAAAYQLAGQSNAANALISGLDFNFTKTQKLNYTYGSSLRDEAMVLETLTIMDKRSMAENLLNKVAAQLSQDSWYSTQTTAYALLAISEFVGRNNSGNKIQASVRINGKETPVTSDKYLVTVPVQSNSGSLSVINKGSGVLFVKAITKGQPLTGESVQLASNPSLLRMKVEYITQNKKPVDISRLMQGSDFIIKVSVTNPGNRGLYRRMALTQIVPSGWEILNTRLFDAGGMNSSPMQYRDIRDDRVYTYFDLNPGETKVFYLNITAAYAGRYYLPAIICNEMYDKEIQASENGRWVTVYEPKEKDQ